MKTTKENTFAGFWPETKENTWFGYETKTGEYEWWKTKSTAAKHIPNKHGWIHRATLIKGNMYINHSYAKMSGWYKGELPF